MHKRVHIILAAGFALCSFALYYSLELKYDRLGVLDQYDVFFDTDPHTRIFAMSHGHESGRGLAHPNFSNFLNPPIRVMGKIVHLSGISSQPELEVRRPISLLVVPLVSAVNVFLMSMLFSRLGFSTFQIVLLAILNVAAFSQIVFGSNPDHFALSNACVVVMYFLVVDLIRSGGKIRWRLWLLAGVVTMGITITNVVMVAILLGGALLIFHRNVLGPVVRTAGMLALIVAVNAAIYFSMIAVFRFDSEGGAHAATFVNRFFSEDQPLDNMAESLDALANGIAPPAFNVTANRSATRDGSKYNFMFTLEDVPGIFSTQNLLGLATIGLMVGGAVKCFSKGRQFQILAACSLGIMAYNLIFHALWGREYFLYSQHWYFASILCLAGMMLWKGKLRYVANAVFTVFVLGVVVNNWARMTEMLAMLETPALP